MLEHPFEAELLPSPQGVESAITVLHIDDDPAFIEMCSELLEMEGERLSVETATSAKEGLEYLSETKPDCIVSDYDMPQMDGLEFLEAVRETHPKLPFILFTGKGSEEIASEAITAGVTDYLQKSHGQDQYRILKNRIENAVANYRSQRSLQVFRSAAEHSGHSIYITDTDGVIEYVNPSFADITGYTPEEAIGRTPKILKSDEHGPDFYADLWGTILDGEVWESEIINERKNGERYVTEQTIAPIFIQGEEPDKFVAVNQEITDRKEYELALERQCENLGALNRMLRYRVRDDLQAVTGYAELLEAHVDSSGEEYLEILSERAWEVFDRVEAAQTFADLLYQTDPEDSVELKRIVEKAAENVRSLGKKVEIGIEDEVSSTPIAADTILESIIRILLENIARQDRGETIEIHVSITERDGYLSIQLVEESQDALDEGGVTLQEKNVLSLDTEEVDSSELYIVQGLIDGYGGKISTKTDGSDEIGFTVEFPSDRVLPEV
jgi:PAS domain S-box-containing protein